MIHCDDQTHTGGVCDDPFCNMTQDPVFAMEMIECFLQLRHTLPSSPVLGPGTQGCDPMLLAQAMSSRRAFPNVYTTHVICNVAEGLAYMLIGTEGYIVQMGEL